jgi:hypothetical protein
MMTARSVNKENGRAEVLFFKMGKIV